ncbi:uncharacterized protein TRIVIDRAFT_159950 [Trichoderma virens Gv29-8]|uniref:NAD(P)-binding protein n=1 Tax=Hypocrea virens (strain Gv29-8 / FGSC 10586) TaxID=413071 RepID=G9N5M9_HYPVG|nr:uncharacterized protein TRIVIDRAFT_159950 [Trichoderma virens Gv29-8]EHK18071.1 hypothetical protein TRIVIDRAFT_159950 [Trichoderma virens Gv29-8]UKZ54062.1 hypothetical protein TrVGV298_007867 [Trichoderma virens]
MSFPNPTAVYHNTPAPVIDPTQKHLSVAGKTVLVTGGGTAIGSATVEAFAKAKADHVFFVGRRLNLLLEVEQRTKFHAIQTDISKENEVKALIQTINKVSFLDILVANAAYLPTPEAIATSDTSDWWKGYEINVLGTYLLGKYFVNQSQPVRGKPVFVGVNTGAINVPPKVSSPMSGYVSSKMATASVVEFLQVENPNIKAFNVSPGTVQSEMSVKANAPQYPPTDSPELMANFAVWLASPESDFLAGRFLWANWDVEGLIAAKEKIAANPGQLQLALEGWWSNFAALK